MSRSHGRLHLLMTLLVAVALGSLACAQKDTSQRGVAPVGSQATTSSPQKNGPYYALTIGINNYRYLPKLATAVNDAKAVAEKLHVQYGFEVEVLTDATRDEILRALEKYESRLPDNANLLVFYAGHGQHDRETDKGYWLPVDAKLETRNHWIIADEMTSDVKAIPARHVLIVSDSCYSGMLTRAITPTNMPFQSERYLETMLAASSRNLMASGADEPVADAGAPGHSAFTYALLQGLDRTDRGGFTAQDLFVNYVQEKVVVATGQKPQYKPLDPTTAGDFVFFRVSASGQSNLGQVIGTGNRQTEAGENTITSASGAHHPRSGQAQHSSETSSQHPTSSLEASVPGDVGRFINLGDQYWRNGDYDKAIAEYQEGLRVDPNNSVLHEHLERARRAKAQEANALQ